MNKEAAISLRLDEQTIAELDRLADLQGTARTAIIRQAISKHLKVQPPKDRSELEPQSDEFRSRVNVVEAELGKLGFLISDLYRLYARSVDSSFSIETAIGQLVAKIDEQNENG